MDMSVIALIAAPEFDDGGGNGYWRASAPSLGEGQRGGRRLDHQGDRRGWR